MSCDGLTDDDTSANNTSCSGLRVLHLARTYLPNLYSSSRPGNQTETALNVQLNSKVSSGNTHLALTQDLGPVCMWAGTQWRLIPEVCNRKTLKYTKPASCWVIQKYIQKRQTASLCDAAWLCLVWVSAFCGPSEVQNIKRKVCLWGRSSVRCSHDSHMHVNSVSVDSLWICSCHLIAARRRDERRRAARWDSPTRQCDQVRWQMIDSHKFLTQQYDEWRVTLYLHLVAASGHYSIIPLFLEWWVFQSGLGRSVPTLQFLKCLHLKSHV